MEPYTRRPRGYHDEAWWAGQSNNTRVLAEVLIEHAAWKRKEVFEHGTVVEVRPGQCLFSLRELGELAGITGKQVRTSREALRGAGFCTYEKVSAGECRTLYSIHQWWRFIQAGKAGELDPAQIDASRRPMESESSGLSPEDSDLRAYQGHNGKLDGKGVSVTRQKEQGTPRAHQGHSPARVEPARTYRAQSTENRAELQSTSTSTRKGSSLAELSAQFLSEVGGAR
jgi:hypothetical protein